MIVFIRQDVDGIEIMEEYNQSFFEKISAKTYLERLCLHQGCSMQGRKEAIKAVYHIHQKIPILISERTKDFFFPTSAIRVIPCHWINHRAIYKIQGNQQLTMIYFHDQTKLVLDVDIRTIKREIKICTNYLTYLESQHKNKI